MYVEMPVRFPGSGTALRRRQRSRSQAKATDLNFSYLYHKLKINDKICITRGASAALVGAAREWDMHRLDDLVVFVRVVERKGISKAAGSLNMTPGVISRRLRRLEEDLESQLVYRSTRHMTLTESGERLYRDCAGAIEMLEQARAAAKGLAKEARGVLKIHAPIALGQSLVIDTASAMKREYPEVTVDLHVNSDQTSAFKHGYDILLRTSRLPDSSLDCHEFGPVPFVVVASTEYLRRNGVPRKPLDLVKHNCLLQCEQGPAGEWRFIGRQGAYSVPVTGSFVSSSALILSAAASRGVGIANVPEYMLHIQPYEDLRVLFDDCVALQRNIIAYYPRASNVPAKVRAFIDCFEQLYVTRRTPLPCSGAPEAALKTALVVS